MGLLYEHRRTLLSGVLYQRGEIETTNEVAETVEYLFFLFFIFFKKSRER